MVCLHFDRSRKKRARAKKKKEALRVEIAH